MKRFNLLSTLLLVAMVFVFCSETMLGINDAVRGFKEGRRKAAAEWKDGDTIATFQSDVVAVADTFNNTVQNGKSGEPVRYNAMSMEMRTKVHRTLPYALWEMAVTLIAVIYAVTFIFVCVVFVQLVRSINRKEIFTMSVESRLRLLGVGLLVIYGLMWAFDILNYVVTKSMVEIPGYRVTLSDTPSGVILFTGIGMFIVAQVFAIARRMKEEQDLII